MILGEQIDKMQALEENGDESSRSEKNTMVSINEGTIYRTLISSVQGT